MIKVKCVGKNRNDKGVIVNYNLVDEKGNKFQATSQQIKSEIKAGKYQFTNLQIDKAGRLVDKAEEKLAQTKVTKITSTRKVEDKEEKKKIAKKEVKDYIDLLKEKYTGEDDGAEKFLKDFSGEGNVEFRDREGEGFDILTVCHMTESTRKYFDMLIKLIEDKALKTEVRAARYDCSDFSAELPVSVQKFMESSGCDSCITEAMFYQAAKNNKLALIKCGIYDGDYNNFVGYMILTANYDKAKEFIIEHIKQQADEQDETPAEILEKGNFAEGDNMLGHVFVLKLIAEAQKRDVEYYKKQVLEIAQTPDYMCDPSNPARNIRNILRTRTCGLAYLALKLGIIPARDDWDTEEEKEREDKITAEAERLAAEIVK